MFTRHLAKFKWYYARAKSYLGRPRMLIQEKAVIIDELSYCEHPIFLVGVHRSGTTLVRRIFNSHPNISCPPETHFINYYAKMAQDDLVEAGYLGLGYDRGACQKDLRQLAARLHEAYRISQGKLRWADKTPQYLDNLDAIDSLFEKKPQYVLIFRHPFDIVFSISQKGWKFNSISDSFEAACVYVRESLQKVLDFEASFGNRCVRVFYDDLMQDPETALRKVFFFLGEGFTPELLQYDRFDHNFGLEDPMIRGLAGMRPSRDNWHAWSAREIASAQKELCGTIERIGYPWNVRRN